MSICRFCPNRRPYEKKYTVELMNRGSLNSQQLSYQDQWQPAILCLPPTDCVIRTIDQQLEVSLSHVCDLAYPGKIH